MLKTCGDVYIEYEQTRDILFVFGAGASIAAGAPLQRDILKLIFESGDSELSRSDAAEEVRTFIQENFYISDGEYPTLEAIFGYLDYFISQRESLSGEYTTSRISDIKEALIKLLHYAISDTKGSRDGAYRKFWEVIGRVNRMKESDLKSVDR